MRVDMNGECFFMMYMLLIFMLAGLIYCTLLIYKQIKSDLRVYRTSFALTTPIMYTLHIVIMLSKLRPIRNSIKSRGNRHLHPGCAIRHHYTIASPEHLPRLYVI